LGIGKFFIKVRAGFQKRYGDAKFSQFIGRGNARRRCADDNDFLEPIFDVLHDVAPVIPAAFFCLLFNTESP